MFEEGASRGSRDTRITEPRQSITVWLSSPAVADNFQNSRSCLLHNPVARNRSFNNEKGDTQNGAMLRHPISAAWVGITLALLWQYTLLSEIDLEQVSQSTKRGKDRFKEKPPRLRRWHQD